jgi:hypothetical protein
MDEDVEKVVAAHKADIHSPQAHIVQQWHNAIDTVAALERGREQQTRVRRHSAILWGTAAATAVFIGVSIGVMLSGSGEQNTSLPDSTGVRGLASSYAVSDTFSRSLQFHLRDSHQQLVGFNADSDTTLLVLRLIEKNRLFETAADRGNAPHLARLLRAFESVLLELTADDISPTDAESLRAQLAFELRVLLTKMSTNSSYETHST